MAVKLELREKVYYNINIVSTARPGEFASDASFNAFLNQALIEDASQYQFMLQKFKIDSESIPLFYVELQQPQPPINNNTNFITNYSVYVVNGGVLYTAPLLYSDPYSLPAKIMKADAGGVYYDNRDEVFALYSYDVFITMVNDAIRTVFNASGLLAPLPFFKYDHLQEKIAYYCPANLVGNLYFSINLYPYVGEAFNTNWYYIKPPLITTDVYSIVSDQIAV